MEEMNFLDVLHQEINKMLQDGIITQEQLEDGINIPQEWLYSSGIEMENMIQMMVDWIKDKNPNYYEDCRESGKRQRKWVEPESLRSIVIKGIKEELQIHIYGNDDKSKFVITNGKREKYEVQQITPEEFKQSLYQKTSKQREDRMLELLMKTPHMTLQKAKTSISRLWGPKEKKALEIGMQDSLCEMSKNLAEYYRYMEKEKSEDEITIRGGIIDQDISERLEIGTGEVNDKTSRARVSKVYPYNEREKIFTEDVRVPLVKRVCFDSFDNNNISKSYDSYIYDSPTGDGYLIIFEPYSGSKETRGIYVPNETQQSFLSEDGKNNDFWIAMTRNYLKMSSQEFRMQPHSYTFKHTDIERYRQVMQKLIAGESTEKLPFLIKSRIEHARRRLFEGELAPDMARIASKGNYGKVIQIRDYFKQPSIEQMPVVREAK